MKKIELLRLEVDRGRVVTIEDVPEECMYRVKVTGWNWAWEELIDRGYAHTLEVVTYIDEALRTHEKTYRDAVKKFNNPYRFVEEEGALATDDSEQEDET